MTRIIFCCFVIASLFVACQSDGAKGTTDAATGETTNATTSSDNNAITNTDRITQLTKSQPSLKEVAKTIGDMIGSNMISSMELDDSKNLSINYYENAEAYNKANSKLRAELSAQTFNNYWTSGSRVEKVVSSIPAEILHKYDFINSVKINLPTEKRTVNVSVTREALAAFMGVSWEGLQKDWENQYGNSVTQFPEKRKELMDALTK